jgi:GNAT superfamily N-acetyltransferase
VADLQPATSSRWLIRKARESEFPAFRMLLPDVAARTPGRILRLAVDSAKPSIAGALAYTDDFQSITNVRLHVVKTCRRQGVGSALLNYAVDEARRLGRTRVFADAEMLKEPDAEAFLTARGFHKVGQLTSMRGPLVPQGVRAALFEQWLAKAEELPPDSRIVKIDEAPADQIAALFRAHIANVPLLSEMHRDLQPARHKESIVVMSGDRVIGFLLASVQGRLVHAPALVVVPEYRRKGLSTRMMDMLKTQLAHVVDEGQYEFTESATFTAKVAADFGHEILRVAVRFERNLRATEEPLEPPGTHSKSTRTT